MITKPDIQLVEANPENLMALKEILAGQGYLIHLSSDGEAALTEALTLLPDLILVESQLPGLDGYQVCRRLKADDRLAEIPVLFICAPDDEVEARCQVFEAGGADYLTRPFIAGEVLARVNAHLALHRASLPQSTDPDWQKQRKQAELARRQSEKKFRIIAEKLTDVIFLTDETGIISYLSPATETVFGFTPHEMVGHHFVDFISPVSINTAVTAFKAAIAHNTPARNLKLIMKRKNGTVFFGELNGSVYKNGDTVGILGVARDITEQQRTEGLLTARLRLVEFAQTHSTTELLQATLDEAEALTGSTIGFYHFLETDQVTLSLQVWSSNTLAARCQTDDGNMHYNVTEAGLWADCIRQRCPVIHNQYTSLPHRREIPAGHVEITRQLVVPVFRNNLITAVIGVGNKPDDYGDDDISIITQLASLAWDIVGRKQAEEKLRQLSQAVEQSPVSVMITNAAGNIEYVNPKFTQVTGYTAAEVMGHNPNLLNSGEQPPEFYEHFWDTILAGQEWRGEFHNRKKDGQLFWEKAYVSPVRSVTGEITHFVGVKEDITVQKQLEEQTRRQERLASVGQLAAGIAHDFNNLLMTIMGNAQLLQRQPDISEKNRMKLMRIVQQGERASQLTRQILDFSRQSIREPRPLDLKVYLNETIKFIGRTIPERIQVQLDFEPVDYTINADPTQLQQIITNLAVNARDAMPRGGTLYFALARQTITATEISFNAELLPGEWITMAVSDTGSGISPDVLPHIFDPFFTTKKVGEGSGLGLAQVYGVVKQHEGFITVDSQVGQGTTFTIFLPALVSLASQPAEPFPSTEAMPFGQGQTILLVEDDQLVLSITQSMLESLNYLVLTAPDGFAALTVFQTHQPQIDLVLTDVVMPNMDGFTLANHLKIISPDLGVVLMSGYPIGQEVSPEAKQMAAGWLQKPVNLNQLAQVVHETVSQKFM